MSKEQVWDRGKFYKLKNKKSLDKDKLFKDWQSIYPKPYNKNEVDPYTKTRIILMNGTEFESVWKPDGP